jgi:ATPase subunit of ABC transporter with duplicated ATPase domains
VDRVNVFLHDTELLDEFAAQANVPDAVTAAAAQVDADDQTWFLGIRDASFGWSVSHSSSGTTTPGSIHTVSTVSSTGKRDFKLQIDGSVSFKRGGVNLIIGPTGSGKTSMLMALLGEMHFEPTGLGSRFSLPRTGGVAYAAQESWVQNESIRENIVFGAPWDEARYKKGK